jgi:uncharacterized protein (TIGR02246 family)
MTDPALQRLIDIEAIKQLKGMYCRCVAIEDWTTFMGLFTEDLTFVQPDGTVQTPRAAFEAFHKVNLQEPKVWGVVHCFTPMIEITGPDTASGVWGMSDVHIWPGEGEGAAKVGHVGYGHYHENYVRTADGWRFKRIQVIYERFEPMDGGAVAAVES